jgi:hypothetical protein
MGTTAPGAPRDVIVGDLKRWQFAQRERALFADASKIPTWRLANQARRLLADVTRQLGDRVPREDFKERPQPAGLPSSTAIQLAVVQLGAMGVRSAGAVISLMSCGYEREALAPARTALEAVIRTRQASDDQSGGVARKLLEGHRPKGLKQVASAYGSDRDVALLDHFAHADLTALLPLVLAQGGGSTGLDVYLEIRPIRGVVKPIRQLHVAGYVAVEHAAAMCDAFGVGLQIPPFIAQQLDHYRNHPPVG